MPERGKKFHEFALQSTLFKGRSDWYFCYLKTEKIAHVLTLLAQSAEPTHREDIDSVGRRAGGLCGEIAHLAAGELDASIVLADVFALLSAVRILVSQRELSSENGLLLVYELEQVAERLARGSHPSPFVSNEDFGVPQISEGLPLLPRPSFGATQGAALKDNKTKGQSERMSLILDLVRKRKSLSIKEIASVIKGCSEKTIQRELAILISQGLVRKVGERRWSLYLPA
jgi:hypothetical protein